MKPFAITQHIQWVGSLAPDLRRFDILLSTEEGTTFNSYLVEGAACSALIDTTSHGYETEFVANLKIACLDLEKIRYIVVNHTEPDHSGAMIALLELLPNVTVVATKTAIRFLSELVNLPFKSLEITEKLRLDLGGECLRFFSVPLLHWPDTMMTYTETAMVLFSCDVFGAHFCHEALCDDLCPDFSENTRYYFDMIMRPFKPKVLQALDKLEIAGIPISIICPSHGPVLRKEPKVIMQHYKNWSQPLVLDEDRTVLILYVSAHGNTKKMAQALGAAFTGFRVVVYDLMELSLAQLRDEYEKAKVLLLGSPTVLGDAPAPVWTALGYLNTVPRQIQVASVFGSFGWSGEAVPRLMNRLKELKIPLVEPPFWVNFSPTSNDMCELNEFAKRIQAKIIV